MSRTVEIEWEIILEVIFFFFHFFLFTVQNDRSENHLTVAQLQTSDMGSHLCCGRLNRGCQPPSTPTPHPPNPSSPTHTHTHILKNHLNAHFPTFRLMLTNGRTDGWLDRPANRLTNIASYRVACPQLKKGQLFFSFQF